MAALAPIDQETAKRAEQVLLTAISDLLEAAGDQCADAQAPRRMAQIIALCQDAITLASAAAVIMRRCAP